jgi:hypothetical protein
LLSNGIITCASCGGNFQIVGRRNEKKYYVCASRRRKGACDNAVALPLEVTDENVLQTLEYDLMRPEMVGELMALAADSEDPREHLEAARDKAQRQIVNLVEAIASGTITQDVAASMMAERVASWHTPKPSCAAVSRISRSGSSLRSSSGAMSGEILRGESAVAQQPVRRLMQPWAVTEQRRCLSDPRAGALPACAALRTGVRQRDDRENTGALLIDVVQDERCPGEHRGNASRA